MIGRMKNGSAIIWIEESKERPQQWQNEKRRRRKEKLIVGVMDRTGREETGEF